LRPEQRKNCGQAAALAGWAGRATIVTMDSSYWIDRWRENRIGFHEGRPNAFLVHHSERLGRGRRVLVPMCGKAEDLAYLAALGHEVLGIELVAEAALAFFEEHGLQANVSMRGELTAYSAGRVTVLVGDVFAATREAVGSVDALYDRAALIALPPETRPGYATHLTTLLEANAPAIVITLEYPQEAMAGPPFSVPERELRMLYPASDLELLDEADDTAGRLRDAGIAGRERCFLLRMPPGG
jgi:thiopurine S-methyltransferase